MLQHAWVILWLCYTKAMLYYTKAMLCSMLCMQCYFAANYLVSAAYAATVLQISTTPVFNNNWILSKLK